MNADTINWIIAIGCGGTSLALFAVAAWRDRKVLEVVRGLALLALVVLWFVFAPVLLGPLFAPLGDWVASLITPMGIVIALLLYLIWRVEERKGAR